jgi:hypothetical protein
VIEHAVDDRLAEAVRLRRALRGLGVPVDVIVMDEALVKRRSKVRGTMVDRALREGPLSPNPEQIEYAEMLQRLATGDLYACRKLADDAG